MKLSKSLVSTIAAALICAFALTAPAATTTTAVKTASSEEKTVSTAEKNYRTAQSTARKYEKSIETLLKKHTQAKTTGIAALQTEYDKLKETYKDVSSKGGPKGAPPKKPDNAKEKPTELTEEQKAEMNAKRPEKGERPEMKQLTDAEMTTLTATLKKYNAELKTLQTKLKAL